MISTRSGVLVIDTVVCLTLAKWETVSGRFGGYLTIGNDNSRLAHSQFASRSTIFGPRLAAHFGLSLNCTRTTQFYHLTFFESVRQLASVDGLGTLWIRQHETRLCRDWYLAGGRNHCRSDRDSGRRGIRHSSQVLAPRATGLLSRARRIRRRKCAGSVLYFAAWGAAVCSLRILGLARCSLSLLCSVLWILPAVGLVSRQ